MRPNKIKKAKYHFLNALHSSGVFVEYMQQSVCYKNK